MYIVHHHRRFQPKRRYGGHHPRRPNHRRPKASYDPERFLSIVDSRPAVLSRDRDNSAHHERCRELDIQDHGSGDSGVLNTGIGKPLAIQGWRA
jgi:hypothetical protein